MGLFRRKKTIAIPVQSFNIKQINQQIPDDIFMRCPKCQKPLFKKHMGDEKNCYHCGYPLLMSAQERIDFILDDNSFQEWDKDLRHIEDITFPGYQEKLTEAQERTQLSEAVVTGKGMIQQEPVAIGVMDSRFIMASMGEIVGEKIARLFEKAIKERLSVLIYTASGGARMQEGIKSLMQMAKISSLVQQHSKAGLLYISFITHPTTGGVTASFAMQGDYIFAEPQSLIGFAGRRVIEQTIRAKLPLDFQMAEQVQKHGFLDNIIERQDQRKNLGFLLQMHRKSSSEVSV